MNANKKNLGHIFDPSLRLDVPLFLRPDVGHRRHIPGKRYRLSQSSATSNDNPASIDADEKTTKPSKPSRRATETTNA